MTGSFWRGSHYLEWLLDKQDVLKHRVNDIEILGSEDQYQKVMIFFSNVIQAIGKGVDVRQQVIATALVYFRRFYAQYSFKSVDPWLMSPSCLFLASKIEEYGVISQKVLMNTCKNVIQSFYVKYFEENTYPYRPADVLECEFILMETLDCSMIIFHPYRSLINIIENLKPDFNQSHDTILQKTWKIINDSYKTDLCLFYPPYAIALGCLLISLSILQSECIDNSNSSLSSVINNVESWFAEIQVDLDLILEVSTYMVSFYRLIDSFDESKEMPEILGLLPKPRTQSQINASNNTSSNHSVVPNNISISSTAMANKPANNQSNPIVSNVKVNQNSQYMNLYQIFEQQNQISVSNHNAGVNNHGPDVILNGGPCNQNQMIMQQHPMAPANYQQQQQPPLPQPQQAQSLQHQQAMQRQRMQQQQQLNNPNFMPQQY